MKGGAKERKCWREQSCVEMRADEGGAGQEPPSLGGDNGAWCRGN